MSLNNIELSPALISQLFPTSLISDVENAALITENQNVAQKKSVKKTDDWIALGNNKKNILVVVHYDSVLHLPDAQLDFLTQLLNACKLSLNEVAVINHNNYKEYSHTEIIDHFKSHIVLLFAVTVTSFGFPLNTPQYQVQQYAAQTFMHAPALHELQNNKTEKGKLWLSLKQIFNL